MADRDLMQPDRSFPAQGFEDAVDHHLFNEWTDEKHNMYLSLMEAAFVKQLYGREQMLRRQKTKEYKRTQKNFDMRQSGQVICQCCLEDYKFERAKRKGVIENETFRVLANPRVQHLELPSNGQKQRIIVDSGNNASSSQSMKLNGHKEERRTSAMQVPVCYTAMLHQDCISRAEVIDQNFADTEHKKAEEQSKTSGKKRSRGSACSKIFDQIVPCNSFAASYLRGGDFQKENDAEFSSIIRQRSIDQLSFYNYK